MFPFFSTTCHLAIAYNAIGKDEGYGRIYRSQFSFLFSYHLFIGEACLLQLFEDDQ